MVTEIIVHSQASRLAWSGGETLCVLGKNGTCSEADKSEGDGRTPLGRFALRHVYYRADRIDRLVTALACTILEPRSGWCDASNDPNYNRFVRHPYPASAEQLWRDDGLYNILVVLGHNDAPVRPGLGSAIFLHCCKYDHEGRMKPTLGCIAIPQAVLIRLLGDISADTAISVY
jgi:L,D-peptidoglycan transpeptidase YkuD (ErfK/YbiS/YcfS/YnhG family)